MKEHVVEVRKKISIAQAELIPLKKTEKSQKKEKEIELCCKRNARAFLW